MVFIIIKIHFGFINDLDYENDLTNSPINVRLILQQLSTFLLRWSV